MLRILLIAAALLLSTGPLHAAGYTATAAQWKDIRTLQEVFTQCGGTDADDWYDQNIKDACALSRKLQEKLAKQGFCFYKRILVGKPGQVRGTCHPLRNPPPVRT